jgi:hypothetical protein
MWLVALMAGVMVAFTGCGGSSGGGGDDDGDKCADPSGKDCVKDNPNPTISVVVDQTTERKVTLRVTAFAGGTGAYKQIQFNDKEPCHGGFDSLLEQDADGTRFYECHIGTVSAGSGTQETIRCAYRRVDTKADEDVTVLCASDSYDAVYTGEKAWIYIPETGGELKYYVTGVQTPKTYFVPVEKEGGNFYFGTPGERDGK